MFDIHHHLLPGLDDGSPDMATSLQMARMAVEDGITHVVCTPHASSRYTFDPEATQAAVHELQSVLCAKGISLQLGSGCDFHLNYDNIQDALVHPKRYSINASEYLLVELPDFTLSPSLKETFYELRLAGLIPILTHPERNPMLQREPERMLPWLRDGLLLQVTAASVLGRMGRQAKQLADRLLANRWVHFVATDAHDTRRRPPELRAAHELISQEHSRAYADLLCIDNPREVFFGRPLGEQEQGRGLSASNPFRKHWWQTIFGS